MNRDLSPDMTRRQALCQCRHGPGHAGPGRPAGRRRTAGTSPRRDEPHRAAPPAKNPLAPRAPHFPAKAKHVIHIYLNGGPSQVDTFDPKPLLKKYEGKMLPQGNLSTERKTGTVAAVAVPVPEVRPERHRGQRDLRPHRRSISTTSASSGRCTPNTPNHEQSMRLMNCGDERLSRPSMGAWLTYGMGTENENLPGFIAMCPGLPVADVSNWRSAFLPGIYQGTYIDTRKEQGRGPDREHPQPVVTHEADQRRQLDLLAELNRHHQRPAPRTTTWRPGSPASSWPTACRWARPTPSTSARSRNTSATLYGPGVQARQLLIARRLIERGVRFVQLYHGDVQPWDSHDNIAEAHRVTGPAMRPGRSPPS